MRSGLWRVVSCLALAALLLVSCGTPLVTQHRSSSPVPFGRPAPMASAIGAQSSPADATAALETTVPTVEQVPGTTVADASDAGSTPLVEASATVIAENSGIGETSAATVIPGTESALSTPSVPVPTLEVATPISIIPVSRATPTNGERWREQEINRQPFPSPVVYTTTGSDLIWYDPVFQQPVLLGSFRGDFDVLATFQLRSSDQPALEVLYEVNKRYGLTALSPAVVERIKAAGYESGFIDTYIIIDDHVQPK